MNGIRLTIARELGDRPMVAKLLAQRGERARRVDVYDYFGRRRRRRSWWRAFDRNFVIGFLVGLGFGQAILLLIALALDGRLP